MAVVWLVVRRSGTDKLLYHFSVGNARTSSRILKFNVYLMVTTIKMETVEKHICDMFG